MKTITLRCPNCDNKLSPGRGYPVKQSIHRSCNDCGAEWDVVITPQRHVVDDQAGTVFGLEYKAPPLQDFAKGVLVHRGNTTP